MNQLKNSIAAYRNACQHVQNRRTVWSGTTKPFLYKVLSKIKEDYNLDALIQTIDYINGKETVNLLLNRIPSGLVQHVANEVKAFVKCPGCIAFAQSHTGLIHILVMYPFIENITSEKNDVIATLEPNDITEDVIYNSVTRFFDLLTQWENGNDE